MIKLKQFLEMIDYRITSGEPCDGWKCFGDDAHFLSTLDGDITCLFDTTNLTVYEVYLLDRDKQTAYRMIHPDYKDAYFEEAKRSKVDVDTHDLGGHITDLETDEDLLTKGRAIFVGDEYDSRVVVPLDLDADLLLHCAIKAHEMDITLNDFILMVIQREMKKKKEEGNEQCPNSHTE